MKTILLLLIVTTLFSCTKESNLSRYIPKNKEVDNIFIAKISKFEPKLFYGATSPEQVKFVKKFLQIKIWTGYWDGLSDDGIIITNNNRYFSTIPQRIIIEHNAEELNNVLPIYSKEYRECEKKDLIPFLDSLQAYKIPYIFINDSLSFNGEQLFQVEYNLIPQKRESWKHHQFAKRIIEDSILSNFKEIFPNKIVKVGSYIPFCRNCLTIAIEADNEIEFSNFNEAEYPFIKTIKKVSLDKFKTRKTFIYYFVRE